MRPASLDLMSLRVLIVSAPARFEVVVYTNISQDVTGELIRKNVVEDQPGVPLFLDVQLIDTNTCEPVPQVYIDLWHCNATVSIRYQ